MVCGRHGIGPLPSGLASYLFSEWIDEVFDFVQQEDKFLNMIMEFIPETLWSVAQCDGTNKPLLEALYVKVRSHLQYALLRLTHSLS